MAKNITTKPLLIFSVIWDVCHLHLILQTKTNKKRGFILLVFLEINNEIYVCLMSHSSAYVLATHAYTELGQIMKIKDDEKKIFKNNLFLIFKMNKPIINGQRNIKF